MSNITIHRCPHDQKNPYVMVNNNLIRDKSISPECRWLLIYLLSNEEGWKISVKQLRNHLEGFWGKNKIYDILKEAVDAGYMELEEFLVKNLKRTRYVVSETPKFKKCFRRPENRDAENRDTENREPASLYNKNNQESKNDQKKENMSELPSGRVTSYFYEKLKSIHEKVKQPNFVKWAKEFELLSKDGNSEADIIKAIDYVISTHKNPSSNGFCWANVILSPAALRKNFVQIWAQMSTKPSGAASAESNQQLAAKIQKTLAHRGDIVFGYNYVEFINGPTSSVKKFDDKGFKQFVVDELHKRKLSTKDI